MRGNASDINDLQRYHILHHDQQPDRDRGKQRILNSNQHLSRLELHRDNEYFQVTAQDIQVNIKDFQDNVEDFKINIEEFEQTRSLYCGLMADAYIPSVVLFNSMYIYRHIWVHNKNGHAYTLTGRKSFYHSTFESLSWRREKDFVT